MRQARSRLPTAVVSPYSSTVLRSLRLLDFRCFATLDLDVPANGGIFIGDNAQGKTSILEAVCVLVRLHSPRTRRMGAMARQGGHGGFGIAGDPWQAEREVRHLSDGLTLQSNQAPVATRGEYLEDGGLVVWMGNEDLELIRGPGEGRRRFLDFIGVQADPQYRRAWSRYRRALQAKNLLLKESRPRDAEIVSYEEILIENGTILMETRARLIDALAPAAADAHRAISGSDEKLTMQYIPASGTDLRDSIRQARDRERRMRQAIVGPHRDDLALRVHGMNAAEFASEGQQRTIALALKLAQGRLLAGIGNRRPLYLLDDIFGELDPGRRNALMCNLPADAQLWITTTHLDWLADTRSSGDLARFRVSGGACYRL